MNKTWLNKTLCFQFLTTVACLGCFSVQGPTCMGAITFESHASASVDNYDPFVFPPFDSDSGDGTDAASASASTPAGTASATASTSSSGGSLFTNASVGNGFAAASASSALFIDQSEEPHLIKVIYSTNGNGGISFTGGSRTGSGSVLVDFTPLGGAPGVVTERGISASAIGSNGQIGSAIATYAIYPASEAEPELPGQSPNNPIKRKNPAIVFPINITASQFLVPVFGDYGQTAPLYFGSSSLAGGTIPSESFDLAAAASTAPEVIKYEFQVKENLFTSFTLPYALPNGDTEFTLFVDDQEFAYTVGETLDFTQISSGGIETFYIIDFDGGIFYDENEPTPFVFGTQFASNGMADVLMVPFVSAIPEPSTAVLFGLLAILCSGRRFSRNGYR